MKIRVISEAGTPDNPVNIGRATFNGVGGRNVRLISAPGGPSGNVMTSESKEVYQLAPGQFVARTRSGSFYRFTTDAEEVQDLAQMGYFQLHEIPTPVYPEPVGGPAIDERTFEELAEA